MKDMGWLIVKVLLLFGGLAYVLCLCAWNWQGRQSDQLYQVSLNRMKYTIREFEEENGRAVKDLQELETFAGISVYDGITGLSWIDRQEGSAERSQAQAVTEKEARADYLDDTGDREDFWNNHSQNYVVIATERYYYKVTYHGSDSEERLLFWVAGEALLFLLGIVVLLWYLWHKLLLPFHRLSHLPYELSKGNLTIPLQEEKNHFFGKFLWGMDLLRENLEQQKQRELALQKEKKLLLLSLSHDIKTPLSAIKLYARALNHNLYQDEAKKQEIAENINHKADEIEQYISEIVCASSEDFLDFQVQAREIYVGEVLEQIRAYYQEKMRLNQISFQIGAYANCLVYADPDRLVEVLQNVVENAIKYGDGESIEIQVSREEEYLISVTNSGCDLPQRELLHIFDSFFRGSNVARQPGSGLGLYICRQLLHQMEGEITAEVEKKENKNFMKVVVALRIL